MSKITDAEVVLACQTLFGNTVNISRDFLHTIQPGRVKSAYRKKAKEHHPDLFAANPVHIQQKQTDRFREIIRAYDVLNLFFLQRETGGPRTAPQTTPPPQRKQRDNPRAAGQHAAPKDGAAYYRGNLPFEVLQIGQYLYYRGKVTFDALIDSLVWQRKQRPSIGDIAVQWGWLDAGGIQTITRACARPRLFGEKAVELGLLSVFQVNAILLSQQSHQERLGDYFVRNTILTTEELESLVRELKEHNACVLASSRPAQRPRAACV